MRLFETKLDGFSGWVVVTEGMIDGSTGERIYGVFEGVKDASGANADARCVGTVGADALTPAQRWLAAQNSKRVCD